MCGRYSLHSSPELIAAQFSLESVPRFPPRREIAPASRALIVKPQGATLARWGLDGTPHNVRAETLGVKLSLRDAYHRRRCLVPADGFYEWKTRPGEPPRPYRIDPAARGLFAFAGLWQRWDEGEAFTVLTVEANGAMRGIHERMPVIIAPEHYAGWLHGEEGLLRAPPAGAIRCSEIEESLLH